MPGLLRLRAPAPPHPSPRRAHGRHPRLAARRRAATWRPTTPSPTPRPSIAGRSRRSRPGRRACASRELLPRHAQIADRFTLLRSMAHTGGGHPAGSLQLLSGDPDAAGQAQAGLPRLHERRPLPALRPAPARCPTTSASTRSSATTTSPSPGRATSATSYAPFAVDRRSERPELPRAEHRPGRSAAGGAARRAARACRRRFDTLPPRPRPVRARCEAMDRFEAQALNLLTSPEAARAFDLSRESPNGPRPLRPQRLGPAAADGPAAGRGGRGDRHHHASTARCAAGWPTGTTTPSTTTSSTR